MKRFFWKGYLPKTKITAISCCSGTLPDLILAPNHLYRQWENEIMLQNSPI
jgi:hypothetical protein